MKPRAQKVGNKLWAQWKGRLYGMPADLRSARARGEETQELVAPFPCKVLKLSVAAGTAVNKGDPVVVVEAMKMEYSYASPRSGIIANVLVKTGDIVPGGAHFVKWKD